ncbi:hypothetical protein PFISCL1PPCAC_25539, partial [Pristionchus fissidentatus]
MFDQEPDDVDDEIVTGIPNAFNPAAGPKSLFYCTDCGSSFIRVSNLIKHIENGKHKIRPERTTADIINAILSQRDRELPEGWALRTTRKTGRYPAVTKAFLSALFEQYYAKNAKLKADEAERQMKENKNISPKEWMSNEQIKSFVMDEVEPSEEDLVMTDEEMHEFFHPHLATLFSDVTKPIFTTIP